MAEETVISWLCSTHWTRQKTTHTDNKNLLFYSSPTGALAKGHQNPKQLAWNHAGTEVHQGTPVKTYKRSRADRGEGTRKSNNIVIPYFVGTSEKLRRIFNKHHILVNFKPTNMVRQKLVHPYDKTSRHKQSNVVYAVQCSHDCTDLYIGDTKQPLHKQMAQHRSASFPGLSPTYNALLSSLPRQLFNHSHVGSPTWSTHCQPTWRLDLSTTHKWS